MLDITLCYSILEFCFDNLNNFEKNNIGVKVLQTIEQHRIVLNNDLGKEYMQYFEQNRPDLVDQYQSFINSIISYGECVKIVDIIPSYNEIDNITTDRYLNMLFNICYGSSDKILLSEICDRYLDKLSGLKISCLNISKVMDVNATNLIRRYTLPIISMRIAHGLPSLIISEWLSRFIKTETEFIILDGYIYQNINNFLKYFLRYVQKGAQFKIYTILLDGITENDIVAKLNSQDFKNWKFELYIINSKKEQHARNIFTNNYCIHIEKGMAIFGRRGFTDQSDITIEYKKNITTYQMPRCRKVI